MPLRYGSERESETLAGEPLVDQHRLRVQEHGPGPDHAPCRPPDWLRAPGAMRNRLSRLHDVIFDGAPREIPYVWVSGGGKAGGECGPAARELSSNP